MNDFGSDGISLGRRRRLLLATCCIFQTGRALPQSSLDGRLDPLFAVETLEPEIIDRLPLQAPHAMVHRQSS